MTNILQGDALETLKTLKNGSINCCVTSPPYYGLRDYGVDGQIGLEKTPQEYIDRLVAVFHEVKRVLRDDGTLWLNIADSYAESGKGAAQYPENAQKYKQGTNKGTVGQSAICSVNGMGGGIKAKDLIGVPWALAFALRADGWYLRQDIIWHKPNPMPESVTDRCTKSHEYIFLLAKSKSYYFDYKAICEKAKEKYEVRYNSKFNAGKKEKSGGGRPDAAANTEGFKSYTGKRNKRSVWIVTVKPIHDAHFATFPKDLIAPCILAGCPKGGTVLDPFFGSGTTGVVCEENGRNCVGIELNAEYIKIAQDRIFRETQQTKLDI